MLPSNVGKVQGIGSKNETTMEVLKLMSFSAILNWTASRFSPSTEINKNARHSISSSLPAFVSQDDLTEMKHTNRFIWTWSRLGGYTQRGGQIFLTMRSMCISGQTERQRIIIIQSYAPVYAIMLMPGIRCLYFSYEMKSNSIMLSIIWFCGVLLLLAC